MQTSSRNGFGTKLLFHRPAGQGLFEATVWVTAVYIPLFPRSTWLVRPQGLKEESISGGTSTTYYVEFLERRRTPLPRVIAMYFSVAGAFVAMWGPMLLGAAIISANPESRKTWLGGLIFLLPLIWAIAMWLIMDYRRDRLYKKAVEQQGTGEVAPTQA
jgi:hypothetical protein